MARKGIRLVYSGKRFSDSNASVRAEVAGAVAKTALAIEARARAAILTGSKTGRVYKKNGIEHRASAPGEAPANDTGTLANSIKADVSHANQDLRAEIVVGAEYAVFLEDLEDGSAIQAARPFIGPALESEAQNFNRRINTAIGRGNAFAGGGDG